MTRTDSASRVVGADVQRVFAALVDEAALTEWLPPQGMTGRFEHFDARPGGSYRLVLTYTDPSAGAGKTTSESDVVEVRFVEIVPDARVVQSVDFVSDDPSFSGTMTMTWELATDGDRTRVTIRAEDVPPGISPKDHENGLSSSLAKLETFLDPH
jgi:uncharacterized protein YndB with AHSA1/START domain